MLHTVHSTNDVMPVVASTNVRLNNRCSMMECHWDEQRIRKTSHTNALGYVETAVYDAARRLAGTGGTTYPTRHGYDTAGWRTSLETTRDGAAWDATQWTYDPATSLNTAKTYADETTVAHAHTADGLPQHTTWARGAWREVQYDEQRRPVLTTHSGDTPDDHTAHDQFSNVASHSNSVSTVLYQRDNRGLVTNETVMTGATTFDIEREYDPFGRIVSAGDLAYAYASDGQLAAISNAALAVEYRYTPDRLDAGYSVTLTNGGVITRDVLRDPYRRGLVISVTNRFNDSVINHYTYSYDPLGRPTTRNSDSFGYNARSEVTSATIGTNGCTYAYDEIGNQRNNTINSVKTDYTSNPLNQYLRVFAPPRETLYTSNPLNQYLRVFAPSRETFPTYDPDGNLLTNGIFSYSWDAENRLVAAYSNSICVVSNAYDHLSRRVLKITPTATHTYLYDGWNLIQATIATASAVTTNHYIWGKDLSGTLQGAGGVGGLLAVMQSGTGGSPVVFLPLYDANGNITAYLDDSGTIVASYTYDAFGRTLASYGPLASAFPHRFSTKYHDSETGLYYYGYRFYSPELMRWLNRDPIEESGGNNLYGFVRNNAVGIVDGLGLRVTAVLGDDYAVNIADIQRQFVPILASIVKMEAIARRAKERRPNARYYFDGELLPGGFDEFMRRLAREKQVIIETSAFTNVEGEVATIQQALARHEFDGDRTAYIHHGSVLVENGTYTVRLKGNPLTRLDTLVDALGKLTFKFGSHEFVHVACFINKETRGTQGLQLLPPRGRVVKKMRFDSQGKEEWYKKTEYSDLLAEDCHVSWGSTRVHSVTVKEMEVNP